MELINKDEIYELLISQYEMEAFTVGKNSIDKMIDGTFIMPQKSIGAQNLDISYAFEIIKSALEIGTFAVTIYNGLKKDKSSITITVEDVLKEMESKKDSIDIQQHKKFVTKLITSIKGKLK